MTWLLRQQHYEITATASQVASTSTDKKDKAIDLPCILCIVTHVEKDGQK